MVYKRYWLPALPSGARFAALPLARLAPRFAVTSLAGEHYRDVSRWLGHSKISTTLDIYASVIASEDTAKAAPLTRPVATPRKTAADNVIALGGRR